MIGSQYVSDPERWRVFYEDLLGGKIDTKQYRPNQKGGRRRPYPSSENYKRHVNTESSQSRIKEKSER
ncbi:hypothetical protein BOW31_12950 [Solemya velum gill symbiont]|nr:hypothetical protein BOW31_12950 [Solemya velum gill symbiont]